MGKKIRAAQASLVATFLAAGGAATAKAMHAKAARPANTIGGSSAINWGDQLVRFMKLDGFPAYLKFDGFAQLAQFYKEQILNDAATLYLKYSDDVANVLSLYQKADAGPLAGILIGLEQFNKAQNAQPLLDYLKIKGNLENYVKYDKWFTDLQAVARSDGEKGSALDFYAKMTGIASVPSPEQLSGGGGDVTSIG
jgi:hypothetical protein